jgi:hypothetical protein
VVEEAIGESASTSGVVSGGKIADYLTEETRENVDKNAILEALTAKPDETGKEPKAKLEDAAEKREEANAKLAELVVESAPAGEPADQKEDSADLEKANEKLKHLTK